MTSPDVAPLDALACGGAPGIPKPGSENVVNFGSEAVQAILAELTDGISAVAFAILFGGITFNGTQFCARGDVGDPSMSVQDWNDALDYGNPAVNVKARTKAKQWFEHVVFPIVCDCANGTAPPPATPPGPPPVATSPNTQPYTIGPNCWQHTATRTVNFPSNFAWNFADTLPQIHSTFNDGPFNQPLIQTPLPASIVIKVESSSGGTLDYDIGCQVNFYNSGGTFIAPGGGIGLNPGQTVTSAVIPVPANAHHWDCIATPIGGNSGTPTNVLTWESTIFCQGQSPTGVNSPCCPPDPSVDSRLGALMEMMTQLLSLQSLAGAYQDTTRHAGLSGDGTITINPASSAIRVEIKSNLSNWPNNPQTPTYYYSLGFVTPFAVGTPLKGQRLVYHNQTFTWPSYTDQIGYALAPGVTVDLVELTRGA